MLFSLWLPLFITAAVALAFFASLLLREFYMAYRGSRAVSCPENHRQVAVSFDALHAASTRLAGKADLRLATCTRWPERRNCGQECMPQALQATEYHEHEAEGTDEKKIYHLPILIAALAAWVFGAVWHSQYIFRSQWIQAVGLSRADVHSLAWRLTPHLLTLALPLLFAYGIAWLLLWTEHWSLGRGFLVAVVSWAVIVGLIVALTGLIGISPDLFNIELGYSFLASMLIGIIVGGLDGRVLQRMFAA